MFLAIRGPPTRNGGLAGNLLEVLFDHLQTLELVIDNSKGNVSNARIQCLLRRYRLSRYTVKLLTYTC